MGKVSHAADQLPEHILDLPPVGHEYGHQGTQMQQHIEKLRHYTGILHTQQVLGNGQMSAAGNGQKLSKTLDQAQQKGRKK